MSMLAGPVSKAKTWDGFAFAGITVMLAMPARFRDTRPIFRGDREGSRRRDERRALSALRDIGGTKVGDGGDAGARGDDGGLSDLQRGGGRAALVGRWFGRASRSARFFS